MPKEPQRKIIPEDLKLGIARFSDIPVAGMPPLAEEDKYLIMLMKFKSHE